MGAERVPEQAQTDRMSPWWWLVLPLGLATALSLGSRLARKAYVQWIGGDERGLLELLHVALPLAACGVALAILVRGPLRGRRWLAAWIGLAALGCLFIAGEEASWGQHLFDWQTPAGWAELNDQGETNLHNVSSWFDQKPRTLLELGVVVGGIVIPIAALWWPALRRGRWGIILPPLICLPSALLAEFARFSERIPHDLGAKALLFYRASEVQETFFYLFILLYLVVLRRRVAAARGGSG